MPVLNGFQMTWSKSSQFVDYIRSKCWLLICYSLSNINSITFGWKDSIDQVGFLRNYVIRINAIALFNIKLAFVITTRSTAFIWHGISHLRGPNCPFSLMINLRWLSVLILDSSSLTDALGLGQPLIFQARYIRQLMYQFSAVRKLLINRRLVIK